MKDRSSRGRLFVLSGPSGVGKSTVLARLRRDVPQLWYAVSATTRVPRPGEAHGVNYFFVSPSDFADLVEARRNRREEWFKVPAGHIELCNVPLVVRPRS